jgi:hypothetical protein
MSWLHTNVAETQEEQSLPVHDKVTSVYEMTSTDIYLWRSVPFSTSLPDQTHCTRVLCVTVASVLGKWKKLIKLRIWSFALRRDFLSQKSVCIWVSLTLVLITSELLTLSAGIMYYSNRAIGCSLTLHYLGLLRCSRFFNCRAIFGLLSGVIAIRVCTCVLSRSDVRRKIFRFKFFREIFITNHSTAWAKLNITVVNHSYVVEDNESHQDNSLPRVPRFIWR